LIKGILRRLAFQLLSSRATIFGVTVIAASVVAERRVKVGDLRHEVGGHFRLGGIPLREKNEL
jgi:hypothetical protein